MFSARLLAHFQDPRNVGELPSPAITVEVVNPACGDILRLSVDFERDRVLKCAFKVQGCVASIAAGSALTEILPGKTREDLAGLRAEMIEEAVGGLPGPSRHAAALCLDAVKALLIKHKQ